MKLGEKLRATVRFIGIFMLMALLALLAMPISVHADNHELRFHANPAGSGNISPITGMIHVSSETGAEISFSVAPENGYSFYKWVGKWPDFELTSYSQSSVMACSGMTDVNAYMVSNSDAGIVVKSEDENIGTVVGTRPWSWAVDGQYFTISATPKDPIKYEFDYWELDGTRVNLGATAEVKMPGIVGYNRDNCTVSRASKNEYIAHFKLKSSEHGFRAVTDSAGGIITGQPYLPYSSWKNSDVTVIAEAAEGYEFDCWLDPDGNQVTDVNGKITVTCPASPDESKDVVYTAKFKRKTVTGIAAKAYDITNSKDGGGVVSPAYVEWTGGESGNHNQSITFTASPNAGMEFDSWDTSKLPGGVAPSGTITSNTITLIMPDTKPAADLELIAKFKSDTKYEVYTEVALEDNNRITPGHGGTVSPAMVDPDPSKELEVTLVAEPHDGYAFDRWQFLDVDESKFAPSDKNEPKLTIKVPKKTDMDALGHDVHIRAVFKPALDDGIWGLALDGGEVSPRYTKWTEQTRDTSFNISATPAPGYEFDHWRYDNQHTGMKVENYSTNSTISVRMPEEQITEDIIYTAVFKKINGKTKNKEIHVEGKETSITKESFLNKWRTWIDPALKYVRSTIQNMARTHTAEDASVYEGNKNRGYDSGKAASDLKAEIDLNNQFKHTQSFDHPVIMDASGFSVSEVSGLNTVFVEGTGSITDLETESYVDDKFGELYIGEIVLSGDIYFENEKGERITTELSANSSDATVVMTGIDTASAARWMLVYKDSGENEFIITPITDATSLIRFTLPDQAGGKITLVSVNYR